MRLTCSRYKSRSEDYLMYILLRVCSMTYGGTSSIVSFLGGDLQNWASDLYVRRKKIKSKGRPKSKADKILQEGANQWKIKN